LGCAQKEPKISKTVFVSVSSKGVKFSDMGFLDEYDDKKSLEVYSLGIPVFKINFDEYVCINSNCINRDGFVRQYISDGLYEDIMNDILSQKQLKIDSNITKTPDGFIQEATSDRYDIFYRVGTKDVYFIEKIGGFKFSVRFVD